MRAECIKEKLDGGTVVLTEPMPNLLTASVGMWIAFGSRNETSEEYGAAHFIEHMLFKGTRTMGPRDLALAIETVGGSMGASASEERTRLYSRVLPEHVPVAISILADMFGRSVFPEEEFTREKEVVLEEIKGHEDTPEDLVVDHFIADIYGLDGLGHSILGYEDTIRGMTLEKLTGLYGKFYRPAHVVVAAAGNLGGFDVPALVAAALEPCEDQPCSVLQQKPCEPDFSFKTRFRYKDIHQTHFCFGYPGVPYSSDDRYVLMLLDMILSGGMSSRLFHEVREKRGLVYDISSTNTCYSDSGFFCVSASTRPENLVEVLTVTISELKKMMNGETAPDEIERVKTQLRASVAMSMESVTSRMSKLAQSEIFYGRSVSDEEILEKINAVTVEDISRAAAGMFRADQTVFSALGPMKGKKLAALERHVAGALKAVSD